MSRTGILCNAVPAGELIAPKYVSVRTIQAVVLDVGGLNDKQWFSVFFRVVSPPI